MNNKVNILIVEDEAIIALDLSQKLEQQGYKICAIANDAKEAFASVKKTAPDLALVDITLKGETNGISVAQTLKQQLDIPIIYLTALSDTETLTQAKATNPSAYIVKPYKDIDIFVAIHMALQKNATCTDSSDDNCYVLKDAVFIKSGMGCFEKIKNEDILFLEGEGSYTNFYTQCKKYTFSYNLTHIMRRLSLPNVVRVHKSYAVNLNKIEKINEGEIHIQVHSIPVSSSFREDLLRRIKFL